MFNRHGRLHQIERQVIDTIHSQALPQLRDFVGAVHACNAKLRGCNGQLQTPFRSSGAIDFSEVGIIATTDMMPNSYDNTVG